jgi:hypothetical protein
LHLRRLWGPQNRPIAFKSLSEELVWQRDIDEYQNQAYFTRCFRYARAHGPIALAGASLGRFEACDDERPGI